MSSRSWERILLDGEFITENAKYGEKLYSWLGYEAFEELSLSALSWFLHQSFKDDPVVRTIRLLRHLMLYWPSEYWKSSMLNLFCNLLNPPEATSPHWKIHRLGHATSESVRGSVTGKQGNYLFHPPDLKLGEIILIPEFHDLVHVKNITPVLMDWTSQGEISISLVKASAAFSSEQVQQQAASHGIKITEGRMYYTTDSLMLAACHIQTDRIVKKFPDALWNRLLILYYPPERFDTDLRRYVDLNTGHLRDNVDELKRGWHFYHEMRVGGKLPLLPDNWINRFHNEFSEAGPRMGDHFKRTVYAHAFAMQPKRYGCISTFYPRLILDEEDLDFALKRMPRWDRGLKRIRRQLKDKGRKSEIRAKIISLLQKHKVITSKDAAKEANCTCRWARKILEELEEEGLVVKQGITKGVSWKWIE